MPIPLIMGIGAGLAGVGQILGGIGQSRGQAQARRDALARQQRLNEDTMHYTPFNHDVTRREDTSMYGSALGTMLNDTRNRVVPQFNFNPIQFQGATAAQTDTSMFNPNGGGGTNFQMPDWIKTELSAPGAMGTSSAQFNFNDPRQFNDMMQDGLAGLMGPAGLGAGFNQGQDALMQMLQGNGGYNSITAQLDPTNGMALNQLVQDGSNFSNSGLFQALAPVEDRRRDEGVATLNANAGSLGRRFGTAQQARAASFIQSSNEDANLRRQSLERESFEAAQARRLAASAGISNRDQMANQVSIADQAARIQGEANRIAAANGSASNAVGATNALNSGISSYNSARSGITQQGMQTAGQLALANQRTGADVSMFNAGAQNDMTRANTSAQQAFQQMLLQQNMGQNTFNLTGANSAAQFRDSDLGRLAQLMQGNTSATNQFALNNSNNALQNSQFNSTMGLNAFNANQNASQAQQQMLMQIIQQGLGQNNIASSQGLQALALRYGQPAAPTSAGGMMGALGQGMGDIGSLLALLGGRTQGAAAMMPPPAMNGFNFGAQGGLSLPQLLPG